MSFYLGDHLKKISALCLIILNTSCANLINGQEQPVELIDGKANIYMTTCSGLAETMSSCHEKAKRTCSKGYAMLNEAHDSSVHREIRFQCK